MCFSPSVHLKISVCFHQTGFHSVVVITFASHAKGPQFETGREQLFSFSQLFNLLSVEEELNTTKALRPRGMKTVAKGVADAKMKVQSLFTLNLNHTRAVPSLRGFLLWNMKEDFCLSGPLLSSSCTLRRFTKDQFSQKEHKTKIVEFL